MLRDAERELSEMSSLFARENGALRQQLAKCQEDLHATRKERDDLWEEMLLVVREPHRLSRASDDAAPQATENGASARERVLLRQLDESESERLRAGRELVLFQSQLEVRLGELDKLQSESTALVTALQEDLASSEKARAEAATEREVLSAVLLNRANEIEILQIERQDLQQQLLVAKVERTSTIARVEQLQRQLEDRQHELSASATREYELQSAIAACIDERDHARSELALLQRHVEDRLDALALQVQEQVADSRTGLSESSLVNPNDVLTALQLRLEKAVSERDAVESELALLQRRMSDRIDIIAAELRQYDKHRRSRTDDDFESPELDRLRYSACGILRSEVSRCFQVQDTKSSDPIDSRAGHVGPNSTAYRLGYRRAVESVFGGLSAVDETAQSLLGLRVGVYSCLLNHARSCAASHLL